MAPQLLGAYLMTSPHRHGVGIYYLPVVFILHETAIETSEGALAAFDGLSELDFAHYDLETEHVWLPGMAAHQIAPRLTTKDKKWIHVTKELKRLVKIVPQFVAQFLWKYMNCYNLQELKDLTSPFEDPSKPLRSKNQNQEQKQKKKQNQKQEEEDAREERATPPPPIPDLPLKDGGAYRIPEEDLEACRALYRELDIEQELRSLYGYFIADPSKLKTQEQIKGSIHSWFRKSIQFQLEAHNGSVRTTPGWKIDRMQKAIRMTHDAFVGKSEVDEEDFFRVLQVTCREIGLDYSDALFREAEGSSE